VNIPGYDAWRLAGPAERDEPAMQTCDDCAGSGMITTIAFAAQDKCDNCNGTGEVTADPEEPDTDYEYERRRDAAMERDE
jgi:RecJ-like exonuclease